MPFVLDASITIVWAMRDEEHAMADLALERLDFEPARVPAIWWYEVRNILLVNERRQRISQGDSSRFLRDLEDFPIEVAGVVEHKNLQEVARQYNLTAYDAAYLELALREHLPLATLDKSLLAAAQAGGIPLLA